MQFSPFKRIEAAYASAPYETRLKVPRLALILGVLLVLLPLIFVSDLVVADWASVVVEAVGMAVVILALVLLARGRQAAAADIISVVATLAFTALPFLQDFEPSSVKTVGFYTMLPVALAAVVSARRRMTAVFLIWNPVAVLLMAGVAVLPQEGVSLPLKLNQILPFLILNFLGTLLIRQIQVISDALLADAAAERAKAEARAGDLAGLVHAVVPALEHGDALGSSVRETSGQVEAIRAAMTELREAAGAYEKALEAATGAASSIHGHIRGLGERVGGQAAAVEQSSAAMEEMSASIGNVASISKEKMGRAKKLLEDLKELSEKASASREALDAATKTLDAIRDISGVIDQIADRTNILAMNAAIEAAHAGEAGKGFAVVAEEIRMMSDESTQNAASIEKNTGVAAGSIESALAESSRTSAFFEGIAGEIGQTVEAFDEIVLTTGQLAEAGREILESIAELNQATQAVKDDAASMSSDQENLERTQRSLGELSRRLLETVAGVDSKLMTIEGAVRELSSLEGELGAAAREARSATARFGTSAPPEGGKSKQSAPGRNRAGR